MKKLLALVLAVATILTMTGTTLIPVSAEELEENTANSGNTFYYENLNRTDYQLTQEQLSAPTKQLIEYILEYPYIVDLYTSSVSSADAYDKIRNSFNGFAELERRSDAASEMLQLLISASGSNTKVSSQKNTYLATLLEVPSYFTELSEQEVSLYLEKALGTSKNDEASTRATVAFTVNGFDYTRASASGYTTSGVLVPLYTALSDHSATDMVSIAQNTATAYGINKLGNATSKYNCHSYAWYYTSTSNTYWIKDVELYMYDDHSTGSNNPSVGSVAVYYDIYGNPLHSAIVTAVNGTDITCKSKWGADGLFEHNIARVPVTYSYDGNRISVLFFKYTKSHSCTITIDNAATHTRTCTVCGWTSTEAHVENVKTGKCITCGLQGPFIAYMNTVPVLPEDDHLCEDE